MNFKTEKGIVTLISLVVLLVLFSSFVNAWGVAPARQFAKNVQGEQHLSLKLINSGLETGYFNVFFAGDLSKYASYDDGLVYLMSDQSSTDISFTLNLPENLKPGKNTLAVVLEQKTGGDQSVLGATVSLVAEVIINVPISGEYVTVDAIIQTVDESKPVPITLSLFNTGTKTIPVWAEIEIKGPTNQPITSLKTEKQVLAVGEMGKLTTSWDGDFYQGNYVAEIIVHYGDSFKVLTKGFTITGTKVVSESISSSDFNLGEIVPVEIVARNNWNTELNGIYAQVNVLKKSGELVQTFKTGPENILPRNSAILQTYWDTSSLLVGDYDLDVVMNFDNTNSHKLYPVSITLDKLNVQTTTGLVTGNNDKGTSMTSMLVFLLLVLIVLNIVGLFVMKKYFKKKK